ncbi:MAG: isocitrate/isopropylmalate dehydrogenase family protein [bacterium]|nr:isocitrate/isopropylmalate dehydrogenase family protein [bacterium]
MLNLCVIEADGIGHEVVPAAVDVLKLVAPDVTIYTAEAGWDCFKAHGDPLPEATLRLAKECGAVLFGAAASPSYPVEGYYVPIVRLRRELQTYASVRPTRFLPVPTARPGVDLIVVRENTEDLYVQHEHTEDDGRTGIGEKRITVAATERIAKKAYELAIRNERRRVTIVHKASVLVQTDGLFRRVALEIAEHFPEIATEEMLVDTAAYWMVKDPTRFDIILTPNMYGDILSDMAAAWGGGLGLAPSLNIGDGYAIAEPVHGCAPDIAGKGIANPTATILSVAMLLRHHWGRSEAADAVESAVRDVLSQGHYTSDIAIENAHSTQAFTALICDRIVNFA